MIIENAAWWLARNLRHKSRYSPTGEYNSEGLRSKMTSTFVNVTEKILKMLVYYFLSDNHLCNYTETIIHLKLSEYY